MSKKNRDGKPTAFQLSVLRGLGCTRKPKTYREAENAIKRLRNHAERYGQKPNPAPTANKPAAKKGVCPKKLRTKATMHHDCHCKLHEAAVKKDNADLLPVVRNGYCIERVRLSDDAKTKARLLCTLDLLDELTDSIQRLQSLFA